MDKQKTSFNACKEGFLKDDYHITFLVHPKRVQNEIEIIGGDLSALGLEPRNFFDLDTLLDMLEINNPISEVQGRELFFKRIQARVRNVDADQQLYLPFKGKNGILWVLVHLERLENKRFFLGRVASVSSKTPSEITYYKKTHQDTLTKLFTRETLKNHLGNIKNPVGEYLMFLDIDKFKRFNDRFGHQAGDELLKRIASAFINVWEASVLYYRLSGDEFCVYVKNHAQEHVINRAKWLNETIMKVSYALKGVVLQSSIGIVKIFNDNPDANHLLDKADKAMYHAKDQGGACAVLNNGQQTVISAMDE